MTPEEKFNKKWDTRTIVEETMRSMGVHNQPAPQTLKILGEVTEKLDKLIEDFHEHKNKVESHIDHSLEWGKDAQPVIDMGKNLQGTSKVMLYFTGAILAVGGSIKIISDIFKN